MVFNSPADYLLTIIMIFSNLPRLWAKNTIFAKLSWAVKRHLHFLKLPQIVKDHTNPAGNGEMHKKQIMVSYLHFFSGLQGLSVTQMVSSTSHLAEWRIFDARTFVPVVNRASDAAVLQRQTEQLYVQQYRQKRVGERGQGTGN